MSHLLFSCVLVMLSAQVDGRSAVGAEAPPNPPVLLRYEAPENLVGAVYAANSKQLLFRFKRLASRSGTTLHVQRDFTYPE